MYLFVILVAACGTGVDTDPETSGNRGSGSGSGDGSASTSGPCAAPDGPRHDYTTASELDVLILGKWRQCSGPTPPTLENSRGIEFDADGRYFVLVEDGKGGLARGTGFSSEGKWDTTQATETEVLFSLRPTPSTSFGDPPLFEDDPRRFAFDPSHAGASSVYVWIGQ
jgi:hypothetical protein